MFSGPTPRSSSNQQSTWSAQHALKLQALQGACQDVGIGSDSLGWAFLMALNTPQHASIWTWLALPGATLLLPVQPAHGNVTLEMLQEHVWFIPSSSSRRPAVVESAAGRRGLLNASRMEASTESDGSCIVIRSWSPPDTALPLLLSPDIASPNPFPQITFAPQIDPHKPLHLHLPYAETNSALSKSTQAPSARNASRSGLLSLFGGGTVSPIAPATTAVQMTSASTDGTVAHKREIAVLPIQTAVQSKEVDVALHKALESLYKVRLQNISSSTSKRITSFLMANIFTTEPVNTQVLDEQVLSLLDSSTEALLADAESSEPIDEGTPYDRALVWIDQVETLVMGELYAQLFFFDQRARATDADLHTKMKRLAGSIGMNQLGINVDGSPNELSTRSEHLIGICSQAATYLKSMQTAVSPAEKLIILVKAHNVLVQGLQASQPTRETVDSLDTPKARMFQAELQNTSVTERAFTPIAEDGIINPVTSSEPTERNTETSTDAPTSIVSSPRSDTDRHKPLPHPPNTRKSSASGRSSHPSLTGQPSADILLPLLIYTIIHCRPNYLLSSIAFIERYRSPHLLQGEASYALVNLAAAVAFVRDFKLENTAETRSPNTAEVAGIRERVATEIGELANTVTGAVDSVIRGLITPAATERANPIEFVRKQSQLSLQNMASNIANVATAVAGKSKDDTPGHVSTDSSFVNTHERQPSDQPSVRSVSSFFGFGARSDTPELPPKKVESQMNLREYEHSTRIGPPIQRFMDVTDASTLTIADITTLLADYKRMGMAWSNK